MESLESFFWFLDPSCLIYRQEHGARVLTLVLVLVIVDFEGATKDLLLLNLLHHTRLIHNARQYLVVMLFLLIVALKRKRSLVCHHVLLKISKVSWGIIMCKFYLLSHNVARFFFLFKHLN